MPKGYGGRLRNELFRLGDAGRMMATILGHKGDPFEKQAAGVVQSELDKRAAGGTSNLSMDYSPQSRKTKFNVGSTSPLDKAKIDYYGSRSKEDEFEQALNSFLESQEEGADTRGSGNWFEGLFGGGGGGRAPSGKEYGSPEEADLMEKPGTRVSVQGRPYLTGKPIEAEVLDAG